MSRLGDLYVFEGVDGSGKSSISAEFAHALQEAGIIVRLAAFPGTTPETLGELVYRIHHAPKGCGVRKLTDASLQTLHIAAHLDAIEETIIPALNRGESVVLDRFWWSAWAYGLVSGVQRELLDALVKVEQMAWGQWRPTRLFYISRREPLRPEPIDQWHRLKAAYNELVEAESSKYPVHVIQNDSALDSAFQQALSFVTVSRS